MSITGKMQSGDYKFFSHAYRPRVFSVSLPSGSYTAQFIDEDGSALWPTFVEEVWEASPNCDGAAAPGEITVVKPEVDALLCEELIRKTLTTSEPWSHTDPGVELAVGLGMDGSDAVRTTNRGGSWTGLAMNLDTRCLDLMKDQYFEFNAMIKLVDKNGNPATNVDPNDEWYNRKSPMMTLNFRKYRDDTAKEWVYTAEDVDKAVLSRPYKADGWNLIHGIFRLPESPRLLVEIDSAPGDVNFFIDSASASVAPFSCNPDELVKNGGLEESQVTKYWDTWGGRTKIDIVTGYGGVGNSIKAFGRQHYSHGPAQAISLDCVSGKIPCSTHLFLTKSTFLTPHSVSFSTSISRRSLVLLCTYQVRNRR